MSDSPKLPSEKVDLLTSRLQGSLKRGRPRRWPLVLGVAAVLALVAFLLWWFHDPTMPPRLEVIGFDSLTVADAEAASIHAALAFPDDGKYPRRLLRGRELIFLDAQAVLLPGQQGLQKKASTDADGNAAVAWANPALDKAETITVRYVDTQHKQGSSDQATLYTWPNHCKVCVIDVEETLGEVETEEWATKRVDDIVVRPGAAQTLQEAERLGYRIVYLSVASADPLVYRKVRGWVRAPRAPKARLAAGPVLGRPDNDRNISTIDLARQMELRRLDGNFDVTVIVGSATAAATAKECTPRVVQLGDQGGAQGIPHAATWADVIPLLTKQPEG
jgi:hypothetical protein